MSKKARNNVKYIIGGVALVLSGALMASVMPDLRRYRRICKM